MATNLDIDEGLLNEAQRLGHHKTKKQAVNTALDEYIKQQKRSQLLALEGQIEYFGDYDYKALRRRIVE
jgi:Arc/MetJ family transcription regulator